MEKINFPPLLILPYFIFFLLFLLVALFLDMPEVLALSNDAEPDLTTFDNKSGLADDMKFLASMPELCDVTFLVPFFI